jgi:hypothetical protein
VLGVLVFLSLIDIIVPKSSNGKAVKAVISLISVSVLLVPIISIIKGKTYDFNVKNDYYHEYLLELEGNVIKNVIKKTLSDNEIKFSSVETEFNEDDNDFSLKKIIINLEIEVINGSEEHINIIKKVKLLLEGKIDFEKVELIIE